MPDNLLRLRSVIPSSHISLSEIKAAYTQQKCSSWNSIFSLSSFD